MAVDVMWKVAGKVNVAAGDLIYSVYQKRESGRICNRLSGGVGIKLYKAHFY